jgi:hypothetical protein
VDTEAASWDEIIEESGLSRAEINAAAEMYANSKKTISGWCLGVTQQRNGVDNVSMIVNLLLVGGKPAPTAKIPSPRRLVFDMCDAPTHSQRLDLRTNRLNFKKGASVTREGLYEFLARMVQPRRTAVAARSHPDDTGRERNDDHSLRSGKARVYAVHANSLPIGILQVLASFTRVVRRRSFSPRSIAPVNERARPLWCASSSWDCLRFSRKRPHAVTKFFPDGDGILHPPYDLSSVEYRPHPCAPKS